MTSVRVTASHTKHATIYRSAGDGCSVTPYFILSRGLLKPPLRFMYCRHVRCLWTLAVSSSACPMPLPWISAATLRHHLIVWTYFCRAKSTKTHHGRHGIFLVFAVLIRLLLWRRRDLTAFLFESLYLCQHAARIGFHQRTRGIIEHHSPCSLLFTPPSAFFNRRAV